MRNYQYLKTSLEKYFVNTCLLLIVMAVWKRDVTLELEPLNRNKIVKSFSI